MQNHRYDPWKRELISWILLKLKAYALWRTLSREWMRQATVLSSQMLPKTYEELLKLSKKEKKNPDFKNVQKSSTHMKPKKTHKWQLSMWKYAQQHMSLGNCKLKLQWDTMTLFGVAKTIVLTPPSAGGNVEQQQQSFSVGMQCDTATLEDNLKVSYKS